MSPNGTPVCVTSSTLSLDTPAPAQSSLSARAAPAARASNSSRGNLRTTAPRCHP